MQTTKQMATPKAIFRSGTLWLLVCTLILAVFAGGCSLRSSGSKGKTATAHKGPRGTKPYTIRGKTYYPLYSAHGFTEDGIASWYGKDFHGKQTANGERYDMYSMTAAHKILPFGTQVRVTNKANGRSIIVRINDRGPFVDNRVIDLTKTGAEKLGMIGPGTARVSLQTLGTVPGVQDSGDVKGNFFVQVGAFGRQDSAENVKKRIAAQGTNARTVYDAQRSLWRVQAGPFSSLGQANNTSNSLKREFPHNFVAAD